MLEIVFGVLALVAGERPPRCRRSHRWWSAARARARRRRTCRRSWSRSPAEDRRSSSPERDRRPSGTTPMLTCAGDGTVDVVLRRANGERIADRALAAQGSCGDLASAHRGDHRRVGGRPRSARLVVDRVAGAAARSRHRIRPPRRTRPSPTATSRGRRPGRRARRAAGRAAVFGRRRAAGGADRRAGHAGRDGAGGRAARGRAPGGRRGRSRRRRRVTRRSARCPTSRTGRG